MIQLARKLDRSHADILRTIAQHLVNAKEFTSAAEIYQSIGDMKTLVHMHISAKQWEDVCQDLIDISGPSILKT